MHARSAHQLFYTHTRVLHVRARSILGCDFTCALRIQVYILCTVTIRDDDDGNISTHMHERVLYNVINKLSFHLLYILSRRIGLMDLNWQRDVVVVHAACGINLFVGSYKIYKSEHIHVCTRAYLHAIWMQLPPLRLVRGGSFAFNLYLICCHHIHLYILVTFVTYFKQIECI